MMITAALCWGHGASLGQEKKTTYLSEKVPAASAYPIIILERALCLESQLWRDRFGRGPWGIAVCMVQQISM